MDEIAVKAGISKGLLFYYFHNKKSLYCYIYQYPCDELRKHMSDEKIYLISDFYERLLFAGEVKRKVIERTPYLMDFVVKTYDSKSKEVSDAVSEIIEEDIVKGFDRYFQNVDFSRFRKGVNP